MITIAQIKKPVENEFKQFNEFFEQNLKNEHILLKFILNTILRQKGKQLRPLFVLLTAKLNGNINQKTLVGASLVELLHTATLIHDDIVDDSEIRRGFFAIHSLWGNKIGVLVGDYLLAKGLEISVKYNHFDLLQIISDAVQEMAKGELIQLKKARMLNITEQDYYEIIRKKTATLIATSGMIGAKSVTNDQEIIQKMNKLGTYIGMAFQIKDDILDIQKNNKIGKAHANDIREKKITLPLIKSLQIASKKEKRYILKLMGKNKKTNKDINTIINFIFEKKGIQQASQVLNNYLDKAYDIINSYPDSDTKQSLIYFIQYNINRKK